MFESGDHRERGTYNVLHLMTPFFEMGPFKHKQTSGSGRKCCSSYSGDETSRECDTHVTWSTSKQNNDVLAWAEAMENSLFELVSDQCVSLHWSQCCEESTAVTLLTKYENKISHLSVLSFITKVIIKLSASAIWAATISLMWYVMADLWQLLQDKSGRHSMLFLWFQVSQFYTY